MTLDLIPHSRPWITVEDVASVTKFVESKQLSTGEVAEEFRTLLLSHIGAIDGILTRNGTQAIMIGLISIGVGKGDEVILPTYVCRNVLDAVVCIGAIPVICDTDQNGLLDYINAKSKMSNRVKAVIAVHTYGFQCNIDALRQLNVPILEDACQAFGIKYGDKIAGTLGDVGVYSFHPTKCLTSGEGGMLVSNTPEIIRRAQKFVTNNNFILNNGSMLSDLNATLGKSQLARYSRFLDRRRFIKKLYYDSIQNPFFRYTADAVDKIAFRFVLRVESNYEEVEKYFLNNGVIVRRGVDDLLHRSNGISDSHYENASKVFKENISIPFYPSLGDEEISRICNLLRGLSSANKL